MLYLMLNSKARPGWAWIQSWSLAAILCLFALRVLDILVGDNFHAVAPGLCYRGAQPDAGSLEQIIHDHGIRTVINLRGADSGENWFEQENLKVWELGVNMRHIGLWSSSLPRVREFHNLVKSLAEDPAPFFLHCKSGSDRTGLASALFLLLRTDATLEQAKKQLGLYFGHLPWGRASCQDYLLEAYGQWLQAQGLEHQPDHLIRWANHVYDAKLARKG